MTEVVVRLTDDDQAALRHEDELGTLEEARDEAKIAAELGVTATVQSRTITTFSDGSSLTSPWTDLPSEEGERG